MSCFGDIYGYPSNVGLGVDDEAAKTLIERCDYDQTGYSARSPASQNPLTIPTGRVDPRRVPRRRSCSATIDDEKGG